MVVAHTNVLGIGLYSIEEVALYARVSRKLARRWFFGGNDAEPTLRPSMVDGKFVSFLEFVQMMAIRELRQQKGIKLEKVRQLLCVAAEHDIKYPFAQQGVTFRWHNELGLALPDGSLIEASGQHRGTSYLREIVMVYKEDLGYDSDGLANLYHAWHWNGHTIDMNPNVRFGEPMVTSCGYSAESLWEAAIDEGSVEAAARAYDVTKIEVETACRYFDMLQGKAA